MKTTFDIKGYLASKAIASSLEGKNVSTGWLGTPCPFCSDTSTHLGINLSNLSFNCWKCGTTGTILKYVMAIEGCDWQYAKKVMGEFGSQEIFTGRPRDPVINRTMVVPQTSPLNSQAIKYIRNGRGFAYRLLEKKYRIRSFWPTSTYKFRIYIPIYLNGGLVGFTTRSYHEKVEPKYLHSPKRESLLFAKETLYNLDNAEGDTAIIVEGPTDVWRIGDGAVATFGVVFTEVQIKRLRERFKRIFIAYDADAKDQAERLADTMVSFNVEVHVVTLSQGDPGSLPLDDIKHLRREIFGK